MSDFDQIAADVSSLKDVVLDHQKGESEKREEFEKRILSVMQDKEVADKEQKRKNLSHDAPIDIEGTKVLEQRGGMFGGGMQVTFEKAMQMSPLNATVTTCGATQQLTELQNLHDACALKFMALKNKHDETTAWRVVAEDVDFKAYMRARVAAGYSKADEILNPLTGTGGGSNLDFTLLSAQLMDLVRIELVLASQFRQIPLTRANQSFPTLTADSMAVLAAGGTGPPAQDTISNVLPSAYHISNPTFSQVTFAVNHCMGFIQFNDDLAMQSVVPFLPLMREEVARSIARAIDQCILDGDATGTHQDEDVAALIAGGVAGSLDFRAAWDGLRQMTITSDRITSGHAVDGGNAQLTPAMMADARKALGKFGRNASELFYTLGVASYYDLIADSSMITWDKRGPDHTIKTGVVDNIYGIDIVLSEFVRTDLSALGWDDITGGAVDRSYAMLANRNRFMLGTYGAPRIETTRHAPMLYNLIQADVQVDFQPIEALTSGVFTAIDSPAAAIYDVAT